MAALYTAQTNDIDMGAETALAATLQSGSADDIQMPQSNRVESSGV